MSLSINKNFSRAPLSSDKSRTFTRSFKQQISLNISEEIPKMCVLSQLVDNYRLTEKEFDEIQQGTIDCVLSNDDRSWPIVIDQNNHLTRFRQLIRSYTHQFLEFARANLLIDDNNHDIPLMIEKLHKYQTLLNTYRPKRQSAYEYFRRESSIENVLFVLNTIDKEQYEQLQNIGLYLQECTLKLIAKL